MKKRLLLILLCFITIQCFGQEKFNIHSNERDSFTHRIRCVYNIKGIVYDTLCKNDTMLIWSMFDGMSGLTPNAAIIVSKNKRINKIIGTISIDELQDVKKVDCANGYFHIFYFNDEHRIYKIKKEVNNLDELYVKWHKGIRKENDEILEIQN